MKGSNNTAAELNICCRLILVSETGQNFNSWWWWWWW